MVTPLGQCNLKAAAGRKKTSSGSPTARRAVFWTVPGRADGRGAVRRTTPGAKVTTVAVGSVTWKSKKSPNVHFTDVDKLVKTNGSTVYQVDPERSPGLSEIRSLTLWAYLR